MGAIDRVAHILPGSNNAGGGQEKGHGEVVVQPEDDIVRLGVTEFDQVLDSAEDTEHLDDQSLAFYHAQVIPVLLTRALDCHSHSRSFQLPRDTTSVTISCFSHLNFNAATAAGVASLLSSPLPSVI